MNFKIGDMCICSCGNSFCVPFKIVNILNVREEQVIEGITKNGQEVAYGKYDPIRLLTPLELAM